MRGELRMALSGRRKLGRVGGILVRVCQSVATIRCFAAPMFLSEMSNFSDSATFLVDRLSTALSLCLIAGFHSSC